MKKLINLSKSERLCHKKKKIWLRIDKEIVHQLNKINKFQLMNSLNNSNNSKINNNFNNNNNNSHNSNNNKIKIQLMLMI